MFEFADLCFMFEHFMAMSYNFCTGKLWGHTLSSIKYLYNILHRDGSDTFIIAVKEMSMIQQHIYNSCHACFHAIKLTT